MVRLRAIHRIAAIVILVVFVISTLLVLEYGENIVTAMVFSFTNIVGTTFPPNENVVDTENILILGAVIIGIVGNIAFTIILTSMFYQFLSGIDVRYLLSKPKVKRARNHVIITPINGMGIELAKKLAKQKISVVFVEQNKQVLDKTLKRGFIGILGNAASEGVLADARLDRALAFFVLHDSDIENVLVTIEAKKLNPKIKIVARIKRLEDMQKLERAGARKTVLPEAAIGIEMGEFLIYNI